MSARYVEEEALLRAAQSAVRNALSDMGYDGGAGDAVVRKQAANALVPRLRQYLLRQPTAPRLIGATRAAAILGVQPPHLARLKAQGRMPDPIPVEGSTDAYVFEEVEALAKKLRAERARRAARREGSAA